MAKLHVGDKMPFFTFQTESQSGLTTESVLRNGRTVFWVLRYIGCTTCRYDIHQIAAYYEEFQKRGVQVYVVMQSDPAVVQEDLKDSPLPYHIICDQSQMIYQTLEIPATATKEERMPTLPEPVRKTVSCSSGHPPRCWGRWAISLAPRRSLSPAAFPSSPAARSLCGMQRTPWRRRYPLASR